MQALLSRLLGWTNYFPPSPPGDKSTWTQDQQNWQFYWVGDVFGPISIGLYILMALVGAAGAVYAIYLGIQLARAEDQSKRDEAKKHLITVLIAIAVTVVLILFFNEIMPMIVSSFMKPQEGWNPPAAS